jgi:hypothetical protein
MPVSKERRRELYRQNPDRQKEANKRYREKYPEKHIGERTEKYKAAVRERVRLHRLKNKYKITQEEWDILFEAQGKACAICKATEPGTKYHWHTDHCHDTNKVRGILCHRCNSFLLRYGTTPEILRAAASYLER